MTHRTRLWITLPLIALAFFTLPQHLRAQMPSAAGQSASPILSASQKAHIQARQTQFVQQVTALKNDKTLSNPQKQAKYIQMRQTLDKDMLSYLTPAQRAQVLQARQKMMGQRRAYIMAVQARIKQLNQLALEINKTETPAQTKQLKDIGTAAKASIMQVQANTSISMQARQARLDAIRAATTAKINAVLTPAQRAKFAEIQQLSQTPPPMSR